MHPSLPTSPLSNETTTLSGNRSNQRKTPEQHSPRFVKLQHPGILSQERLRKVELFANHLAEVFTPNENTLDPEVERELASQTQHSENLQAFTLCELKQVIKCLHPLKATGSNLITAQMLQKMPSEGLQTPLYIFKAITRLKYRPVPLKHAKIIMIPKPGKNPTDVTSYRPISLLPVISKILEKLLLLCISSASEKRIPLHNNVTVLQIQ